MTIVYNVSLDVIVSCVRIPDTKVTGWR